MTGTLLLVINLTRATLLLILPLRLFPFSPFPLRPFSFRVWL